jgi:putative ATPase
MKHAGYGTGYRYVHNDPAAKEEMDCLPERLHGRRYFQPEDSNKTGEASNSGED